MTGSIGGLLHSDNNIPEFGEPYKPIKVSLSTTNPTQIMTVPYFWGNATAQFYPTRIEITNTHATNVAVVGLWDDDLTADSTTVRTPGSNGSSTAPLIWRYVAAKSTTVISDFKRGFNINLGVAAITDNTTVDVTVYGYMRK